MGVTTWLYFTYREESIDFKPPPTDPVELNAYEIEIFREYLRIPSVHPDVDYSKIKQEPKSSASTFPPLTAITER